MRKIVLDREALCARVAEEFAAAAARRPDGAFGFTAVDVPPEALEAIAASGADFSKAAAFNACEYVGPAAEGEASQASKLRKLLYDRTPFAAVHVPAEGIDYDAAIRAAGGLELVLLGVGERGHVAFCEPGADFSGNTGVMKLAEGANRPLWLVSVTESLRSASATSYSRRTRRSISAAGMMKAPAWSSVSMFRQSQPCSSM